MLTVAGWLVASRLAADDSGGWVAGDPGFYCNARVPEGTYVSVRVVKMGGGGGLVVTYSGNRQDAGAGLAANAGKAWTRSELEHGAVYYLVGGAVAGNQLAVRAQAANGGFDRPVRVQAEGSGYRLDFASGRVVEIRVGGAIGGDDISGGWVAGDVGFASSAAMPEGAEVVIRIVQLGNSRGLVVTFSGNAQIAEPGKLWNKDQLQEGEMLTYRIGRDLAGRQLAVRSGAAGGGFDQPLEVEPADWGYRLSFAGGRVVNVIVTGRRSSSRRGK